MIRQAALYLASSDDARAAALPVAGRPLAFRAVLAAVRAGAARVGVPVALRGAALERAIARSPRARAAVVWLPDGCLDDAPALLLPAAALAPRLAAGAPVGDALAAALARGAGPLHGDAWFVRARDAADARRAEAHLYAGLGSPLDTRLDRAVHRRLSRPVSHLAVAWGIGPNSVTLLSLGAGAGAGWCLWGATPASALAALGLYLVAVVLDHSDGEVARLSLSESALGEWLDIAADTVVHALLVLGMGVTTARVAGGAGVVAGVVAAAGVAASAVLAKLSPTIVLRGGGDRLGRLLAGLGNRDGYYAMLVGFILALAALPAALPALMVLVAAGSHAYWLGRAAYALRRR